MSEDGNERLIERIFEAYMDNPAEVLAYDKNNVLKGGVSCSCII
jgi:hypothetical protein